MPNVLSQAWRSMFRARKAPTTVDALPRLPGGGAPVGIVSQPNDLNARQTHPLIGANTRMVDSAMRSAFGGQPAQLMDLFDDMRDRGGRVDAVCRTRALAVMGRPWGVEPRLGLEDDDEARAVAERCRLIVSRIRTSAGGGWRSVIGEAMDGALRGFAVFEVEWGVSPEGWQVPVRLHWRHPNRFLVNDAMRLELSDNGRTGYELDAWGPDKFVVHSPSAGRASYITRRGVLLPLVFPVLMQRYGYRWWLKATERWGMPLPVLEGPEGSSEANRDEGLEMLNHISANWNGVLWGGWRVGKIEGSGNLRPEVFSSLIDKVDTHVAIQVLGQNLTTEVKGGSHAAEQGHDRVRQDIATGDTTELDDWVSAQLLEAIVRYNWPGAPVPQYVTEWGEVGEITIDDVKARLATPNEYRTTKNLPPIEDGDEMRPALDMPSPSIVTNNAAPSGGADAEIPFAKTTVTPGMVAMRSTWPTSRTSRTMTIESELSRRLAAPVRSRNAPSSKA